MGYKQMTKKVVYNLGAGNTPLSYFTDYFSDWDVLTVDIEHCSPDIVSNLLDLKEIETESADAFWMCHVLEHFYWHDLPSVLNSVKRILKDDGFGVIKVPDLGSIYHLIPDKLNSTVYKTDEGLDITPLDMIYGCRYLIYDTTNDDYRNAMSHKTGFTAALLSDVLKSLNFNAFLKTGNHEITAIVYKNQIPDLSRVNF